MYEHLSNTKYAACQTLSVCDPSSDANRLDIPLRELSNRLDELKNAMESPDQAGRTILL